MFSSFSFLSFLFSNTCVEKYKNTKHKEANINEVRSTMKPSAKVGANRLRKDKIYCGIRVVRHSLS